MDVDIFPGRSWCVVLNRLLVVFFWVVVVLFVFFVAFLFFADTGGEIESSFGEME